MSDIRDIGKAGRKDHVHDDFKTKHKGAEVKADKAGHSRVDDLKEHGVPKPPPIGRAPFKGKVAKEFVPPKEAPLPEAPKRGMFKTESDQGRDMTKYLEDIEAIKKAPKPAPEAPAINKAPNKVVKKESKPIEEKKEEHVPRADLFKGAKVKKKHK